MHNFTPGPALVGGVLIGLSASLYLWTHGNVAGISGILGGLFERGTPDRADRLAFLCGMIAVGVGSVFLAPGSFEPIHPATLGQLAVAGVLVGVGTRLGAGCTSGHGVCGLSRGSPRSLVATLVFMAVAGVVQFGVYKL